MKLTAVKVAAAVGVVFTTLMATAATALATTPVDPTAGGFSDAGDEIKGTTTGVYLPVLLVVAAAVIAASLGLVWLKKFRSNAT